MTKRDAKQRIVHTLMESLNGRTLETHKKVKFICYFLLSLNLCLDGNWLDILFFCIQRHLDKYHASCRYYLGDDSFKYKHLFKVCIILYCNFASRI